MTRRYLLLLGSDHDDDGLLQAALKQLGGIGELTLRTAVQRLPSDTDDGRLFFNTLVSLACDLRADPLVARLKRIEQALGRSDDPQDVAIDIDLLAEHAGNGWQADAHAVAKGEFDRPAVRGLLGDANIAL